jgi:hypothetical protein
MNASSRLEHLTPRSVHVSAPRAGLTTIAGVEGCPSLRRLDLSFNSDLKDLTPLAIVRDEAGVESARSSLSLLDITATGVAWKASSGGLECLRPLCIVDLHVGHASENPAVWAVLPWFSAEGHSSIPKDAQTAEQLPLRIAVAWVLPRVLAVNGTVVSDSERELAARCLQGSSDLFDPASVRVFFAALARPEQLSTRPPTHRIGAFEDHSTRSYSWWLERSEGASQWRDKCTHLASLADELDDTEASIVCFVENQIDAMASRSGSIGLHPVDLAGLLLSPTRTISAVLSVLANMASSPSRLALVGTLASAFAFAQVEPSVHQSSLESQSIAKLISASSSLESVAKLASTQAVPPSFQWALEQAKAWSQLPPSAIAGGGHLVKYWLKTFGDRVSSSLETESSSCHPSQLCIVALVTHPEVLIESRDIPASDLRHALLFLTTMRTSAPPPRIVWDSTCTLLLLHRARFPPCSALETVEASPLLAASMVPTLHHPSGAVRDVWQHLLSDSPDTTGMFAHCGWVTQHLLHRLVGHRVFPEPSPPEPGHVLAKEWVDTHLAAWGAATLAHDRILSAWDALASPRAGQKSHMQDQERMGALLSARSLSESSALLSRLSRSSNRLLELMQLARTASDTSLAPGQKVCLTVWIPVVLVHRDDPVDLVVIQCALQGLVLRRSPRSSTAIEVSNVASPSNKLWGRCPPFHAHYRVDARVVMDSSEFVRHGEAWVHSLHDVSDRTVTDQLLGSLDRPPRTVWMTHPVAWREAMELRKALLLRHTEPEHSCHMVPHEVPAAESPHPTPLRPSLSVSVLDSPSRFVARPTLPLITSPVRRVLPPPRKATRSSENMELVTRSYTALPSPKRTQSESLILLEQQQQQLLTPQPAPETPRNATDGVPPELQGVSMLHQYIARRCHLPLQIPPLDRELLHRASLSRARRSPPTPDVPSSEPMDNAELPPSLQRIVPPSRIAVLPGSGGGVLEERRGKRVWRPSPLPDRSDGLTTRVQHSVLCVPSQLPRSRTVLDPVARNRFRKPSTEIAFPPEVVFGTPVIMRRRAVRSDHSPLGEQARAGGGPFGGGVTGSRVAERVVTVPPPKPVEGWGLSSASVHQRPSVLDSW